MPYNLLKCENTVPLASVTLERPAGLNPTSRSICCRSWSGQRPATGLTRICAHRSS